MKELDSFTVERLEELSTKENIPEVAALARIALAAKRAEGLPGNIYPDISGEITALEKILKWILNLEVPTTGATNRAILLGNTIELLRDYQKPIVASPQLNSPEIPDGWIKCRLSRLRIWLMRISAVCNSQDSAEPIAIC
ncbi:hypothetical protein [Yersinia enterocolitica]|uniref:hypothetical protein n=1 Tax=Yersinia enterocolitica TaxID=630 RepID=UPI001C60CDCC|nr:hypothetical protein [Yersinia enterocolitica]MBW5861827.1 hypothetical protein [Yersinia enterocolitica]MBW5871472.1 hypothetical protein [Yersinia enterocolitica]